MREIVRSGEQLNYIPKWGGLRTSMRTGRYGTPRDQYRSKDFSKRSKKAGISDLKKEIRRRAEDIAGKMALELLR